MKQPVYAVSRQAVIDVINHQSMFTQIPWESDWGIVTSAQELIDAINLLNRTPDDKIDMSRLSQCIQGFYTSKMPGDANRMLVRIWAIIKTRREIIN